MYAYPIVLTPARDFAADESGFVVTCPDLPELITQGEDLADAELMARDALETVIRMYVEDRKPLPAPSAPRPGEIVVQPALDVALRARLAEAMAARKVGRGDLADRLGVDRKAVQRLLDWGHRFNAVQADAALRALDYRLDVRAIDVAPRDAA
jgi:antitoxin HicB